MPKSCKNVQYDLRKYVSFFKSIPSPLDGEFSSISFLDIYQRPISSCPSWEFLEDPPPSEVPWCDDSPGKIPAMLIFKEYDIMDKDATTIASKGTLSAHGLTRWISNYRPSEYDVLELPHKIIPLFFYW